ncbi:MAG: DNA-processing protein DprA, partial [Actinomycetota bacterium]
RASRYGIEVAELLGRELAEAGITVVSGLAWGIDAAAHRGALAAGGATVAVLGNGLDVCFPKRNRWLYERIAAEGTLISEYEAGTPALRHNFPLRNRIIAGISCAAVIVEATAKGGAMITARLAMEYGRDVFAMPGPVHSPASAGCHALVRDGARLVTCARDVLEDLGWLCLASEKQSPHLDPDESRVLGVLEAQGILLETLARRCRMPISTVSAVMTRLEIRGLATHCPGGRFALAVT